MPEVSASAGVPVKLAGMMFLQYAALGAWVVPLAGWLLTPAGEGGLGFSAGQTASIYSCLALGGLIAPFVTGLLADRYFASEKLVGVLHLLMAGLAVVAADVTRSFAGSNANPDVACQQLFFVMLLYSVAVMLGITVANSMAMRSFADPRRMFGRVRLVGTLGWIVATAVEEWLFRAYSADSLYVSASCHLVLGLLAWWLPHTPPKGRGRPLAEVVGLPAVKLFGDRSFVVFAAVAFFTQIMQQFYTVFANKHCTELGLWKPGVFMTLGQWVEMGCMAAMPWMAVNIGLKRTMALGLFGWVLRNLAFASGDLTAIVAIGLPMHGWSYTFFTVIATLYIDREAPPHLRAGAQALLTFVSGGPGTLLGFYICGQVKAGVTTDAGTDWFLFWMVPAVGTIVATVAFLILFHEPTQPQPDVGPATPELEPENP